MPNNETIERIAEKYVYCCESKEKHELAYCAPCGETKNVELAIVAALSEMRTIALREAAEVIKHGFGYNLRREDGVAAILGRIDK